MSFVVLELGDIRINLVVESKIWDDNFRLGS